MDEKIRPLTVPSPTEMKSACRRLRDKTACGMMAAKVAMVKCGYDEDWALLCLQSPGPVVTGWHEDATPWLDKYWKDWTAQEGKAQVAF